MFNGLLAPPPATAASTLALRHIGTRCFPPMNGNISSLTDGMSQCAIYLRGGVKAGGRIVMEFPGGFYVNNDGESVGGSAGTLKASIRLPDGTWLLSNENIAAGNAPVAHPVGYRTLTWTLPAAVRMRRNFLLLVRACQHNPGGFIWSGVAGGNSYGSHPLDFMDFGSSPNDKTTNGAAIGPSNGVCYFPAVVATDTADEAVIICGTSREAGGVGVTPDYLADQGITARSLGRRIAYTNYGLAGTLLSSWNAGSHAFLLSIVAKGYWTFLTNEYGINDNGDSPATMAGNRTAFAKAFKAAYPDLIVIGKTLYHYIPSSDLFTTKLKQSPGAGAMPRVLGFNALVRAGIDGEDMCCDDFAALDPYVTGVLPVTEVRSVASYTPTVFTGAISADTLTVTGVTSGPPLNPGDPIMDPTDTSGGTVAYNTVILQQLTSTETDTTVMGGKGTYKVSWVHDGGYPHNAAVGSRTLSTAGRVTRDGLHLCWPGEDIIARNAGPTLQGMILGGARA